MQILTENFFKLSEKMSNFFQTWVNFNPKMFVSVSYFAPEENLNTKLCHYDDFEGEFCKVYLFPREVIYELNF